MSTRFIRLRNSPVHIECTLRLSGSPSLGQSCKSVKSAESGIGMRDVLEPVEKRLSTKNAEFAIVNWLSVQPLFLNNGMIQPATVTSSTVGGPLDRMQAAPTRKAKPGGNCGEANGRTFQIQVSNCGAHKRGDRGAEHLWNLKNAIKGDPPARRVVFDLDRSGTGHSSPLDCCP